MLPSSAVITTCCPGTNHALTLILTPWLERSMVETVHSAPSLPEIAQKLTGILTCMRGDRRGTSWKQGSMLFIFPERVPWPLCSIVS